MKKLILIVGLLALCVGANAQYEKLRDSLYKAGKYDYVDDFIEGFASVRLNGKCGFINTTGKEITPLKYDRVDVFNEGLARVRLNGKYGYIDTVGKEIIPPKYDYGSFFIGGFAKVTLNNKWFFIDETGKIIREDN